MGAGIAVIILAVGGTSFLYTSMLARRLVNYKMTILNAEEQKKTLDLLMLESQNLKDSISQLSLQDKEIKTLLGLPLEKKKTEPAIVISNERKKLNDLRLPLVPDNKLIFANLEEVRAEVNNKTVELERIRTNLAEMRRKIAFTPSGWPLWGRIISNYGWRVTPWVGMHTGVDITAAYGAPIRSTADGVVIYASWRTGYGRCVMVQHTSGLSTLYGHCSSIIVSVGQRIKRGQLLAFVGTSGYSTGPHLHYEVRRNDIPINPVVFLDSKLYQAARSVPN